MWMFAIDRADRSRVMAYGEPVSAASSDRAARLAVALPPLDDAARRRAAAHGWHVELLHPEDPDERGMLIRLAHPDFDDAIERRAEEVLVGGAPVNPRLHLAIHEVVAAQIIDADPPEVFETAQRLLDLGREPHEVLHMLGATVTDLIWAAARESRAYDRAAHLAALRALPETWDAQAEGRRPPPPRHRRASEPRRRRRR
jgi:hypothetical protein